MDEVRDIWSSALRDDSVELTGARRPRPHDPQGQSTEQLFSFTYRETASTARRRKPQSFGRFAVARTPPRARDATIREDGGQPSARGSLSAAARGGGQSSAKQEVVDGRSGTGTVLFSPTVAVSRQQGFLGTDCSFVHDPQAIDLARLLTHRQVVVLSPGP